MIFGKRREHKLPKFPEHVIPTFRQLSENAMPLDGLPGLRGGVEKYLAKLEQLVNSHPQINIELARSLANCSFALLDKYEALSEEQQQLASGAILYFIHYDDPMSDTTFGTGFDDDARVMNHVLEELEMEDLIVPLN